MSHVFGQKMIHFSLSHLDLRFETIKRKMRMQTQVFINAQHLIFNLTGTKKYLSWLNT